MAYADKMCFTKEEYIEIKKLWLKTRKKQIKELGSEIYMYPFSNLEEHEVDERGNILLDKYKYKYDPSESDLDIDYFPVNGDETFTVFNVSTKTELWLLKNFKLSSIKREVEKQLGEFWYQEIPEKLRFNFVEDLDFSLEDRIFSITKKDKVKLFFYKSSEKEGFVDVIERGIFYENTDILRVIHEAKEQLRGYKNYGYVIEFKFCGLQLVNNKGKTIYKNKHIFIPYMNTYWKTPKLKHSYNIKDASKYKNENIFISGDDIIADLSCWKEPNLKRILFTELNECFKQEIK